MPLGDRFLVHTQIRDDAPTLGLQTASDGPLHHAPGFMPTQAQQSGRPQDICFEESVDRIRLKLQRKARARQRPRHAHPLDAVEQAIHPRQPCVQPGQPRPVVQMPPPSRRGVVVQRQHGATLGTAESSIASMVKKDTDALVFLIEDDLLDAPWSLQRQQLRKYVNVAHGLNPLKLCPCVHYKLPTAKSEGAFLVMTRCNRLISNDLRFARGLLF